MTIEIGSGDVPTTRVPHGLTVHAIQTGTVAVKTRQREGDGRRTGRVARTLLDRSWTDPLPIFAWVIEHPRV